MSCIYSFILSGSVFLHFKSRGPYGKHMAKLLIHFQTKPVPHDSTSNCEALRELRVRATLTARYCGVRVPRPARFPQVEALLSCWICCTSCCCRRRCSLSLCVSANFTTKGEEQPWSSEEVRDVRVTQKNPLFIHQCKSFPKKRGVSSMPQDSFLCLLHSYQS